MDDDSAAKNLTAALEKKGLTEVIIKRTETFIYENCCGAEKQREPRKMDCGKEDSSSEAKICRRGRKETREGYKFTHRKRRKHPLIPKDSLIPLVRMDGND